MEKADVITDEKSFLNMVKSRNLTPLKVAPSAKLSVQLICDEEGFLQTAESKSSEVYYFYVYPKDHEVMITGATFDEAKGDLSKLIRTLNIDDSFSFYLDREIYPEAYLEDEDEGDELPEEQELSSLEIQLKKDIMSYNANVDKELLAVPFQFMTFYIDNGCLIGINKEIPKPIWSVAEKKLFSMLNEYRSVIEEKVEAAEQHKCDVREKVKTYLMNDVRFLTSTNQALRDDYARTLWYNKECKWVHDGFEKTRGGYPPKEFFTFIERAFREMKYLSTPRF